MNIGDLVHDHPDDRHGERPARRTGHRASSPAASATIAFIGDTKFIVDYFTDHVVISRVVADTVVGLTAAPTKGVKFRAITFTRSPRPPGTGIPTGTVTFIDTAPRSSSALSRSTATASRC